MRTPAQVASLTDAALLDEQRLIAVRRRELDVDAAVIAGEIDRRSARTLGYEGLAQRAGFLSTAALIQSVTGGSRADASKMVAVGSALDSTVGAAVLAGALSVDAAAAIGRGLGDTGTAALPLIEEAKTLNTDELLRRARDLRESLDADAVARREKQQADLRYLRYHRRPDGMIGGSFLFDPIDGALFVSALEAVLSPRRGGPRFVEPEHVARDAAIDADQRSTDQITADTIIAMVQLAIDADPGTLFGARRPAVRLVLTATRAVLEDSGETVSLATAERFICDVGTIPIQFDTDGHVVNVGRTQRLFTQRQRIGLAVRDGGCRFPRCERPPSWTEAHHINQWHRDSGNTNIADGILLCRRHHLLIHNNHWHITRDGANYWITPPGEHPTPMPTKNRAHQKQAS